MAKTIKIGSRKSRLAQWQSNFIAEELQKLGHETEIVFIDTKGDQIIDKPLPSIGGKGLFTEALENALRSSDIDCAVHSLKDLPTEDSEGLKLAAVPKRADVEDVLISRRDHLLKALPHNAKIGTSSHRRAAQLKYYREDLEVLDIRGNVPTRIKKALAEDSPYDAIVLAKAGVDRLELSEHISQVLPLEIMLNASGQGALGLQTREDRSSLELFSPLNHLPTWLATTAERAFLNHLDGGCAVPVAAYASLENTTLTLKGRVISLDGIQLIEIEQSIAIDLSTDIEKASNLGREVAQKALEQGAENILKEVRS